MKTDDNTAKLKKSLNSSKLIILLTNILASILFLVAYFLSNDIWFLIISIALIALCIVSILVIRKLHKKLFSINNTD